MFFTSTCAWIQGLLKKGFLNNNEKIVYIISSYKKHYGTSLLGSGYEFNDKRCIYFE